MALNQLHQVLTLLHGEHLGHVCDHGDEQLGRLVEAIHGLCSHGLEGVAIDGLGQEQIAALIDGFPVGSIEMEALGHS